MVDSANQAPQVHRRDGSPISKTTVTSIVTLPGPVNGMTLATLGVIDRLREATDLRLFDLASAGKLTGWKWKIYKQFKVLLSVRWLKKLPRTPGSFVYLAASSNTGLWQTVMHVRVAKKLGYRIALHHHVFSYLSSRDSRMAQIQGLLDEHDVNVVLSPEMTDAFAKLYTVQASSLQLNYAYMMKDLLDYPAEVNGSVRRIGHLSNLTVAKGFDLVLETFRELRRRGTAVELVIAGPCMSSVERELLAAAQAEFPGLIDYRGRVFGETKQQFFDDIDVFLMPTKYVNEAQPLVILEALSRGKPVVAYARGCIGSMFASNEGVAIEPTEDFPARASTIITDWMNSVAEFESAQRSARARAESLQRESTAALERLVGMMSSS